MLFFKSENWATLFMGLTNFCTQEIAKENLKLILKKSSSASNAEIYLIVKGNVDSKNWTKDDVIGAV